MHKNFDTNIYNMNRNIRKRELIYNSKDIKIIKARLLNHILVKDKNTAILLQDQELI